MLQLMQLLKNHDEVEELYYKYKKKLFHIAMSIVKDENAARDIVQTAVIRVINKNERIQELNCNQKAGYLVNIVKNLAVDHFRKEAREKTTSLDDIEFVVSDFGNSAEDNAMVNLELGLVKRKMKEIDEKYRHALILKHTLGYTYVEMADMLDITVENAKIRCYRARKKLIEALRKEADHE